MKIKRYFAPDMRRAISMVREDQGPDAVILSNKKVNGGIEIVAAVDYDAELVDKMASDVDPHEREASSARKREIEQRSAPSLLGQANDAARRIVDANGRQQAADKVRKPLQAGNLLDAIKSKSNVIQRPDFPVPPVFQREQKQEKKGSRLDNVTSLLTPITDRSKSSDREMLAKAASKLQSMSDDSLLRREENSGLRLGEKRLNPKNGDKEKRSKIEWSQDPSIVEMRNELQTLREIMNDRLTGLVWGEKKQTHPLYVRFMQYMMQMGMSPDVSNLLAERVDFTDNMGQNLRQAMSYLASQIQVTHDDILNHGGRVALLGPTGAGKTTTIAKLAARYTLRNGPNKVALVTTDCYRIGASKQLQTYGRILGVSVHVANNSQELHQTLDMLHNKDLVLIDTAGISHNDEKLQEQIDMLEASGFPIRNYVVLAANTQRAVQDATVKAYSDISLEGVLITKLDETTALGESISVAIKHQLPLAYICDGQMVPEDIHPARANNLVNRTVAAIKQSVELPNEESVALSFSAMAGADHG